MIYLRQSTASQEVPLGHFVDDTDGKTAETGLTIANTDIKIWKTGATTLASKNSGGGTHISGGIYYAVLDATDTDTIGPLVIFIAVSGALAVRLECCVLDEAVFDAMFGTVALATATNITAATGVDITKILGTAIATPATAGILDVNLKNIANAAVSASTAQLGVNVVNFGGSAGTFSGGVPEVNAVKFAGQTITCAGGVTIPAATLASTINITAGTITTVTNLTNAPTSGDFTATMKTSIGTAVAASAVASVTGNVGGNVGGNVTGSVGSISGVTFPSNFSVLSISASTGLVNITQAAADKVWGTTTRLLTAGTNISLAKGTGVTGFNDLDGAAIAAVILDDPTFPILTFDGGYVAAVEQGGGQLPTNAQVITLGTNIITLLSRLGAFTGTGVNTVLGFFKSLLSKTASTPSDVGGTFSAATDSTEAIRDRGDAAWTGGGGGGGTQNVSITERDVVIS